MVASLFQVLIGFSGVMGFVMKFIGPLSIAPTIALAGLALFDVATRYACTPVVLLMNSSYVCFRCAFARSYAKEQWWIALVTIFLIAMFSQYTKNIAIPCFKFERGQGCVKVNFPLFRLFPVRQKNAEKCD